MPARRLRIRRIRHAVATASVTAFLALWVAVAVLSPAAGGSATTTSSTATQPSGDTQATDDGDGAESAASSVQTAQS